MRTHVQRSRSLALPHPGRLRPAALALKRLSDPLASLKRVFGNRALAEMVRSGGGLVSSPIRAKLAINAPGDIYEQEADRVAERVTGGAPAQLHPPCDCGGTCGHCQASTQRAPAIVGEVLSSPGQPLEPAARSYMEGRFGREFGNVRVHRDERAQESAQSVNALAYTVGNHLVFGPGQYDPAASEGRRLLAHELTHVVQQQGPGTLQRAVCPGGHWRHADTDRTALEAYDKIERAHKALEAVLDDPAVSHQAKLEMAEAIRRSIVSLRAYMKEIEGRCSSSSGGGSPMVATTATGINPLHAAVALFATLLVADTARRSMSASEQHAVSDLSSTMGQLANAARKLAEPVPAPVEESTPAPVEPTRTIDPIPPVVPRPEPDPREDDRRRRKRCSTDWVPRLEDTESQRYHNDFARQMVIDLQITASPDLEFRVYRGSATVPLDYDSHDGLSQDFYEFKTRYQYLPYERLGVTWFATSGMVAQARDQKATMLDCGYYTDLVWVFDNEDVANAARPFLESPDAADRVIAEYWAPTRPASRRRGR
jgi:hypothetical protein